MYYYCWARRARERHSPTKYYRSHNFTTEIINNKNVDQPGYSCKYATDPHQTRHQPKFTTLLPMLLKAQQLPTRYAHKMELKEINEFAAYASDGTARNSASLLITLFSALIFMRFRFKWSFVNFVGVILPTMDGSSQIQSSMSTSKTNNSISTRADRVAMISSMCTKKLSKSLCRGFSKH